MLPNVKYYDTIQLLWKKKATTTLHYISLSRSGGTADAHDSKSCGKPCGFKSRLRHQVNKKKKSLTGFSFFVYNDISVNGNDIRFTNDIADAMIFALSCKWRKYHIIVNEVNNIIGRMPISLWVLTNNIIKNPHVHALYSGTRLQATRGIFALKKISFFRSYRQIPPSAPSKQKKKSLTGFSFFVYNDIEPSGSVKLLRNEIQQVEWYFC